MRDLAIFFFLGLSACRNEPSFDERYEIAREKIKDKAGEIDQELDPSQIGREASESRPLDSAD